jgi:hypothetical protein
LKFIGQDLPKTVNIKRVRKALNWKVLLKMIRLKLLSLPFPAAVFCSVCPFDNSLRIVFAEIIGYIFSKSFLY